MDNTAKTYLKQTFGIQDFISDVVAEAERDIQKQFDILDGILELNQLRVIKAFQDNRISDTHFAWNTGYGYDDAGRDAVERVYADVFGGEKALVRTNIVNGTHALAITLFGLLKAGDELIYATGRPYDTLEEVIGIRGSGMGSLIDNGVIYRQTELTDDGGIDMQALRSSISDKTKMVSIQRSMGYGWHIPITVNQIAETAAFVHEINPDIIIMVDNSYGEFVASADPVAVGADIMAGSLIKNPGGGIALSGGYVCGRADLVEKVAYRMTCPGIGAECGLTFGQTRGILQGLFFAPKVVNGAVKGALLCGRAYQKLGYEICPDIDVRRSDIIQAVRLGDPDSVVAFCDGIQRAAPIDSHVTPVPWAMPGYENDVVMASGAFVQGSSIELSADAPIREPYNVYFQGGLTYQHAKFGVLKSLNALYEKGLLKGYEKR